MENASAKGVLGHLSFLEARSKQKKPGAKPQSREQELKAKVEELKKQRDRLRAEIDVHQTLQKLRTSLDNDEDMEMDDSSENAKLLRLMAKQTQLKDVLLAHHLMGGYDVVKTNQNKSLCFSLATAYQGAVLDTYNIEISVSQTLRITRHNIPPFIPVKNLAEETNMQENIRGFLDTLSLHLNAFVGRRQQVKLVKERHSSVEVLETNALCSLLVLMLTEPKTNKSLLCSLEYLDHSRSLPTCVTVHCEECDVSSSPQWQKNTALLQDTPAHEALEIMRKTGQIISRDVNMMRAVCVDEPGGPETLRIRTIPRPEPGPGEVLVRVHATALNRADLLQRRGLYPPPPGESEILGLEVSGTVEATGPGVKSRFKPSDRVMALLCGGGYAEFVKVPEDLLLAVPPNLSLSEAAALPEAWLTAFQLLHFVARVQEGEVVLVHAGGSGVGSAAVQLVRLFKAVPLVTAGTQEKLALAKSLGAAEGFNYRDEDYVTGVQRFTAGRGADVILDCIGGSSWQQNVSCLALDGRWVLYGTLGGSTVNGDLLKRLLSKRGQLLCSLLRSRSLQYKSSLIRSFSSLVLPHFCDPELLRPVIDSEFSLDQVCEAHSHMEANRNMGKIILNIVPKEKH